MLDITITATRRPEILFRTLNSFYDNMLKPIKNDCNVIINVDPVGHDIPSMQIVGLVSSFFRHYHINMPSIASFPKAFVWCWRNTHAKYILHLEDDWELLQPVNIRHMITIMDKYPQLAVLRLPWKPSGSMLQKNWKCFYPWNGDYFECPQNMRREVGFCGHPSLIRGAWARIAVECLNDAHNPEKQFHHGSPSMMSLIDAYQYGTYGQPNAPSYVRDIGRPWMIEHGFAKKGIKAIFTEWEKV